MGPVRVRRRSSIAVAAVEWDGGGRKRARQAWVRGRMCERGDRRAKKAKKRVYWWDERRE